LDHDAWLNPEVCGIEHDPNVPEAVSPEACAAAGEHLRRNGTWVVFQTGRGLNTPFQARALELRRRYLADSAFQIARDMYASQSPRERARARPTPTSTADWVAALVPYDSATRGGYAAMLKYLPMLAGTDCALTPAFPMPGFELHEMLAVFVVKGMSPLEALRTATLNPALALHAIDSLGTVAAGKVADLVLLDADPLANIWNTTKIRAVVANGRYYDRAALDGLLADAERAAHR
jgi:hypothetical protein